MNPTQLLGLIVLLSSTASALPSTSSKATSDLSRAYLVNCWTNPTNGARSEINFFKSPPLTTFGHAKADCKSVVSDGSNYVWEDGGTTAIGKSSFQWIIDESYDGVKSIPAGAEVGRALLGGNVYTIVKESLQSLYVDGIYDCLVVYSAIQINQDVALKSISQPV